MSDLIRRSDVLNPKHIEEWDTEMGMLPPVVEVSVIESIPTVDAVEVKHGRWYDKGSLSCRCSECGCKNTKESRYCPNCGAKMDGEGGDGDG